MTDDRVSDERLDQMIGRNTPCVPATPAEVATLVHEIIARRAAEPVAGEDGLLPCPFCGGAAEIVDAGEAGEGARVVCCTNPMCMASSKVIFALKDDVTGLLIEAWNRRALGAQPEAEGWRDWQLDAWSETLRLADARHMESDHGSDLGLAHLHDMGSRIHADMSTGKLGRWLGWAQAAVVAAGCATLEEMKGINKRCSEASRTPATEPRT